MEFGLGKTRNFLINRINANEGEFKTVIFKNTAQILKNYLNTLYKYHREKTVLSTDPAVNSINLNCSDTVHHGHVLLDTKYDNNLHDIILTCAQLICRMTSDNDLSDNLTPVEYKHMTYTIF